MESTRGSFEQTVLIPADLPCRMRLNHLSLINLHN